MHYLITGGAGFLGSHLGERLLASGDRVTVLDDLSFGRRRNLAAVEGHAAFRCEVGSVRDRRRVDALVREADAVVHLAAVLGVERVSSRPLPSLLGNLEGSLAVLRAASRHGRPLMLASSSEVYGAAAAAACEDDAVRLGATTDPRWGYACAKAMDEWLAFAYAAERRLPVRVVRFFNVAGPRQRAERGAVVPRFVRQALRALPLTVHGDGQQTRSFCHVRDAVEALSRLLRTDAAVGQVVNVGSDAEVTILHLAETVRMLVGVDVPIAFVPRREALGRIADVARRVPDLRKLRELTGFLPSTPLAAIVGDVVAAMRRRPRVTLAGDSRQPPHPSTPWTVPGALPS
ncbi:MAG: NAD-dependent epimerase/dehydratase family protein [Planctomycetota bacterium]